MMYNKEIELVKKELFFSKNLGILGAILCSTELKFNDVSDTACTNGEVINFNPEFWNTLTFNDKLFLLAHELWHIALMHMIRVSERNKSIWNIAADIVINNMLIKSDMKYSILKPIHDFDYSNMSTEQVYNELIKKNNTDKQPKSFLNSQDIIEITDSNPKKQRDIINKVNAIKHYTRNNSNKEIIDTLNKFLKPKLSWNRILKNYMSDMSKNKRSFSKPNRRYNRIIMPTFCKKEGLEIINFYIDISASVSDKELKIFNTEVNSIKNTFNPKEINIISFDTDIIDETKITEFNKFDGIKLNARGGTNFKAVIKHISKTKPNCAIIMSDMCTNYIPKNPHIPVIWLKTYEKGVNPEYGKIINVNIESY